MAGKPLTSETIAMTEKKMDMALDDIIKMSKTDTAQHNKKQRVLNRSQNFLNNANVGKSLKLRRVMDSKSSLRQGVLAQRRSNFQGNQFPLAVEAARKAANVPIWNRTFNRNRSMNMNKPRISAPAVQRRPVNGGFALKQQQQIKQQQQKQPHHAKVISKQQKPQTLDSLFANMKEQRMKVMRQQNGSNGTGRRNGSLRGQQNGNGRRNNGPPGQQRPRPPWRRYNEYAREELSKKLDQGNK